MAKTRISARTSAIASAAKSSSQKASKAKAGKIPASSTAAIVASRPAKPTKDVRRESVPAKTGVSAKVSTADTLDRAEAGITAAIEALNHQMNAALAAVTELAMVREDRVKAVVRTAPLDRATAMFRRLVAEVVDSQLAEVLSPLVALRNEVAGPAAELGTTDRSRDLCRRVVETLDHVLVLAGVQSYEVRAGETFDPLIHLAVRETHRGDLADGLVAEQLQLGFRSARGKILSPAKVCVNRR